MKTKADLYREYARIIDMTDGTGVDFLNCVKNISGTAVGKFYCDPVFNKNPNEYFFAIAVVEEKPVFVGDKLWHNNGTEYAVQAVEKIGDRIAFKTIQEPWIDGDFAENYSWAPPKPKTFTLNGSDLPAPTKGSGYVMHVFNRNYCFESRDDVEKVKAAIINLLDGK